MKMKQFREKSVDELKKELLELFKERFNLRMQKSMAEGGVRSHLHRRVRRDIARVKTLLRERDSEV